MPHTCMCAKLLGCLPCHLAVSPVTQLYKLPMQTDTHLRISMQGKGLIMKNHFHPHFTPTCYCTMQSSLTLYGNNQMSLMCPVHTHSQQYMHQKEMLYRSKIHTLAQYVTCDCHATVSSTHSAIHSLQVCPIGQKEPEHLWRLS
jgi:hypothetical protein